MVPEFKGFNDFIATFPLRRGKTKSPKDDEEDDTNVGEFKVKTAIHFYHDNLILVIHTLTQTEA